MNLRDKALETATIFCNRAQALANAAVARLSERAPLDARARARVGASLAALKQAGRELRKVAGLHASQFVAQNSTLVRNAGKDVSALARSTYQQLAQAPAVRKPRKTASRKRVVRARRAAKAA